MANRGQKFILHGKSGTPIYQRWCWMKERCDNPNNPGYKNYGGRGITYEERWKTFDNFFEDMGEIPKGMSLDRIDNNRNYSKENCRWTDRKTQAINRRNTRLFEKNGVKHTLTDWGEILKIKRSTLAQRLYVYKWDIKEVLSTNQGKVKPQLSGGTFA